jgi:hypothetical protein
MFYSASTGGFYTREIHGGNIPEDAVEITDDDHAALMAEQSSGKIIQADKNGKPIAADPPPLTQEQLVATFTDLIQKRLDDFAKTRNYDGILSACTYATSAVAKFKSEGQYCVDARDSTWSAAYTILDEVQYGTRQMPVTIADIEADLPILAWPA